MSHHPDLTLSGGHQSAVLAAVQKLCRIFWGPDPAACAEMVQADYFQPFEILADLMTCDPADALAALKGVMAGHSDPNALQVSLEAAYIRLFVNRRGGIAAPLYQSCYEFEGAPLMGAPAQSMQARLAAKGLAVTNRLNEPPDHLAVELEYLYFLLQRGWTEGRHTDVEEAVAFSAQTMLPWIETLAEKLSQSSPDRFYPLCAAMLCALLRLVAGLSEGGRIEG